MLKLNVFLLSFTIAILSLANCGVAQDQPVFKDDFEKAKSAEKWKKGYQPNGVEYIYDKENGNESSRSLCLNKTVNGYRPPYAQWERTFRNKDKELGGIKVVANVKTENATKAVIDAIFLDADGEWIKHEWVATVLGGDQPLTHDWKEYSGVVAIPAGTKKIRIALQMYGPGKVWFDDVEVSYAASGENAEAKDDQPEKAAAAPAEKLANQVEVRIGEHTGSYLGVPARNKTAPADGYGMLIVLPGGDGSADFHPFVASIAANSLSEDFVLAQPLAKKWTDGQQIVWPTSGGKVKKMGYTTEQLIEQVIEDVKAKTKVDPNRIFLLGWSSGGPAVYASLLDKKSSVSGGLVAMSVYKPDLLPKPKNAGDRSVYILHSRDDRVCPHWMAKKGFDELEAAGVRTKMVEYAGGHGWHGDVFGNIKGGVDWLMAKDKASE